MYTNLVFFIFLCSQESPKTDTIRSELNPIVSVKFYERPFMNCQQTGLRTF